MSDKAKDFVKFQSRRKIINLCKNFLFLMEDLKDEKGVLDDETYQKVRKRVLDYGNDTIRELEESIETLRINF